MLIVSQLVNVCCAYVANYSPVEIGLNPENLKKADFSVIRKQLFHRITYPKSSKILLGETFYAQFHFGACIASFLTFSKTQICAEFLWDSLKIFV